MRLKLYGKKAVFEYGPSSASELTTLDIAEWYQNLGGTIEPDTEIEFVSYFPGTPYEKTAFANKMPETYLCEGSGSAVIHQPDGKIDHLSISIYRDTTGHALTTMGDHYNLFLQYKIGRNNVDQTDEIPNRHLPLGEGVIVRALLDDHETMKKTIH
jgi:hypothetical protein